MPFVRKKKATMFAWDAFQQLVNLADKAQIPIGGGAFGVTNELINIYNSAEANKEACQTLLKSIAEYSSSIWDLVRAMTPHYIQESEDDRAVIAREGIKRFGEDIEVAYLLIKKISHTTRFRQLLEYTSIQRQINDCEKRLQDARHKFEDSRTNVIVAEYRIPGVKLLHWNDFELLSDVKVFKRKTFWQGVKVAKVENEERLVKMYPVAAGGLEAFQKDMEFMQENLSLHLPRIHGYCSKASVPYISFNTTTLISTEEYLFVMSAQSPSKFIPEALRMILQSADAAFFLVENEVTADSRVIQQVIKDSVLDTLGEMMVSMPHYCTAVTDSAGEAEPELQTDKDVLDMLEKLWTGISIIPYHTCPRYHNLKHLIPRILTVEDRNDLLAMLPDAVKGSPGVMTEEMWSQWPEVHPWPADANLGTSQPTKEFDVPFGNILEDMQLSDDLEPASGLYSVVLPSEPKVIARMNVEYKADVKGKKADSGEPESEPSTSELVWRIEELARQFLQEQGLSVAKKHGVEVEQLVVVAGETWQCDLQRRNEEHPGNPRATFYRRNTEKRLLLGSWTSSTSQAGTKDGASITDLGFGTHNLSEPDVLLLRPPKGQPTHFFQLNAWRDALANPRPKVIFEPDPVRKQSGDTIQIPGSWSFTDS